jgi:hypothetical protein
MIMIKHFPRWAFGLLLGLLLLLGGALTATAQSLPSVPVYVFWGDGCPHCAKLEEFLERTLPRYPRAEVKRFEVWSNADNAKILQKVAAHLEVRGGGVPFTVIGDEAFIGYAAGLSDAKITERLSFCLANGCPDETGKLIAGELATPPPQNATSSPVAPLIIDLPWFGETNLARFSLPLITIILGGLDGFNPCAMWALLFLISLLLGMKNRRRMWLLGVTFIVTSALVYFLFLAAWLNIIQFLGYAWWLRVGIGLVALIGGGYSLHRGSQEKAVCVVATDNRRQEFFERLKQLAQSRGLPLALLGIILLAAAVNTVELLCSAGLPAVYTQVLALNPLTTWQYYGYLLLYIFFFMLDDLIVFFIAMTTLRFATGSSRYTRWSNLIGGTLMVLIGLALLFRPGWLMF